jgi:endonuclease YncB( thermonuclease family)
MKTLSWRVGLALCSLALCVSVSMAGAASKAKHQPKPPPEPVELTGTVTRVVDGDTLWLKSASETASVVVRIEGIDAPESCQPGGAEATAWLTDLVLNRTVTVKTSAHDEFGRTVGKVFDGGRDIGDRMVRDGQAWSLRYKFDRGPYMAEERMALALKRGLHAAGGAIEPRAFRKQHGECKPAAAGAAAPAK